MRRLKEAEDETSHIGKLRSFARYCIDNGINCLTFNYDDFFDQSLFEIRPIRGEMAGSNPYWHPDGGYGFFCKPSTTCIWAGHEFMDQTAMFLLKLHGSVNWRIRRGATSPYKVDDIIHDESWLQPPLPDSLVGRDKNLINIHMESVPFIIPPVLMKSALTKEPILQVVWSKAYEILSRAEQVVFIGYSLPITDIAAGFLFGEGLQNLDLSEIKVVILPDESGEEEIRKAYKNIFPKIKDKQFEFRDALEWVQELLHNEKG